MANSYVLLVFNEANPHQAYLAIYFSIELSIINHEPKLTDDNAAAASRKSHKAEQK